MTIPSAYTDMSERDLLMWQLDNTKPWIIRDFVAIPEDRLTWRPAERCRSAAHILGHIISTERAHFGLFLEGVNDLPARYGHGSVFASLSSCDPTEAQVREAMGSREDMIAVWADVRQKSHAYLCSISDEDLKEVPPHPLMPDNDPNRQNPVREWIMMTVRHQNIACGEIHMIRRIIESHEGS